MRAQTDAPCRAPPHSPRRSIRATACRSSAFAPAVVFRHVPHHRFHGERSCCPAGSIQQRSQEPQAKTAAAVRQETRFEALHKNQEHALREWPQAPVLGAGSRRVVRRSPPAEVLTPASSHSRLGRDPRVAGCGSPMTEQQRPPGSHARIPRRGWPGCRSNCATSRRNNSCSIHGGKLWEKTDAEYGSISLYSI